MLSTQVQPDTGWTLHTFPSFRSLPYLLPFVFCVVLVAKQMAQPVGCCHLYEEARAKNIYYKLNPNISSSPSQTALAPVPQSA